MTKQEQEEVARCRQALNAQSNAANEEKARYVKLGVAIGAMVGLAIGFFAGRR